MSDNQTIKDRILLWTEYQNISVSAFERKCGLSVGYVSNLKPNTNSKKINDILRAYPQLNKTWLLTGEGSMLNETPMEKYDVSMGVGKQMGGTNEFKFEIGKELINEKGDSEQVKRLKFLLTKANQEISHLQGRVEEQDKFIKMLIDRK